MAKRRKLEAPSAEDLSRIEAEFRRETPGVAPIAQVAAESAMNMQVMSPEIREKLARLDRLQNAEARGLVAQEIDLELIDASALTRDRIALDPDEFKELKASIVLNGLRMPIEVYEMGEGGAKRYGLISGYRRFLAVRELRGQPGQAAGVIEAFVREPKGGAESMEAMVEENEVRSSLTHYERGRISVLAAQHGFYDDVQTAVSQLFRFASKAKRSKIRSFAVVFEELGDVLTHAQALTEKQGLQIAAALKAGQGAGLREALARADVQTGQEEWAAIETAIKGFAAKPSARAQDAADPFDIDEAFPSGARLRCGRSRKGVDLRLDGPVDDAVIDAVVAMLRDRLRAAD